MGKKLNEEAEKNNFRDSDRKFSRHAIKKNLNFTWVMNNVLVLIAVNDDYQQSDEKKKQIFT